MKRTIVSLVSMALALGAAPASAQAPIEGTVAMQLNPGIGMEPCPGVTWAGTLEVTDSDGQDGSYGLVLSTTGEHGVYRGDAYLFEENYAVLTEPLEFGEDGQLTSCTAGEVLLSGWDAGVGIVPKGEFWDSGFVEMASGPFEGWLHARTYQDGAFTEFVEDPDGNPAPVAYAGSFRLEP